MFLVRMVLVLAALAAMLGTCATGASAGYETGQSLDSDQFAITGFDASSSVSQAGATTDFHNRITMKAEEEPSGQMIPYGRARRFDVHLPSGLVGDPTKIPTCSVETFLRVIPAEGCPPETQVGIAEFKAWGVGSELKGPVFNLTPGQDQPALFGIKPSPVLYTYLEVEVTPDGELVAVSDENPIVAPVTFADVTMWGVPADHTGAGARVRFMTNPTNCSQPFEPHLDALAYEGNTDSAAVSEAPRSGCENVPFAPAMQVTPSTSEAGAPSGLEFRLSVPQTKDPDAIATAHVKDVKMTLPAGMRVSAASANGLGSCAPDQFGYHQSTPISCPLDSKVGTVEVKTPLLAEPMVGPVYVAKQNDNPFNSLLALYMAPEGQGARIKLAGKVDLDPRTGQVTTTFLDNPQQPFEELRVTLKGGAGAPLVLPNDCGTYAATAELTSWARPGEATPLSSSFPVDQGCGKASAFTPGFDAGTANPTAGAFSPFTLRVTRPDGQQNVERIEATLPEGMLAKLAGVPLCPDAAAASGTCPAASQVGRTTVGVGAGPNPGFAPEPGKAPTALYLGGPYKGGPYSLIAEVPAQAGPFDLGTVVLRNALRVDPTTAQVTAISDPLPQILQGVPIEYRDVRVEVDRPQFTVNPTSCATTQVDGRIGSAAGATAAVSDGFGVSGCGRLAFKPRLTLRLSGGTGRTGHPALRAVLTQPAGDNAGVESVTTVLPRSQFIDNAHIKGPCTRVQFNEGACPPKSILGYARAYTPLLDQPLEGPVYFRSNGGERQLPDLVADLNGQIHLTLVGFIDSVKKKGENVSRVRARFLTVPDAPVSKFVLNMFGGERGLLQNSANLCETPQRAVVRMDGQNGKTHDFRPRVGVRCGKGTKPRPGH